jgi:protein TonB
VVDPPRRAPEPPRAEGARTQTPPAPQPEAAPDPAPQPAPAPEAPPAQAAAGGAAAQGNGSQAEGTGTDAPSSARLDEAKSGWGAKIRARIERRKDYPAAADGASGKVTLALVVGRDGRLVGVDIAASSGNAALDHAALKAVERAGRFPAAPRALTEARYSFALSVSFRP